MAITFEELRTANLLRLPQFKNRCGLPAHSKADGSDWPLDAWCNALAGQVGNAANIIKKMRRGDLDAVDDRASLADELADIAIYLDLLAYRANIDLGKAIRVRFNATSERITSDVRL